MSNKLVLAVGADKNYLSNSHLQNYFKSINQNSNFDKNILVYLGNESVEKPCDNIEVFCVDPTTIRKPNKNNCLQHGEFLLAEGFSECSDSDIIVFTDGDMTLQRSLTDKELEFLKSFKDGDVSVGYNDSPTQTLFAESYKLQPKRSNWTTLFEYNLQNIKCYNTGVLCMNKATWKKLTELYVKTFDWVDNIFDHYAKQQFLISYIIGTKDFNIIEMGYNIHNHTHAPSPHGTTNENGLIKHNGEVVLFKHRWF